MNPLIRIDEALKRIAGNNLTLGVVQASVTVTDHDADLWREIDQVVSVLADKPVEEITGLKEVQALRAAYKALGKDPSRHRGSNEALLRRIAQSKELYKVNTIVDINNLISLESRRSVASYDQAKLGNEMVFRRGREGESYQAIGKGILNIEGLPVFVDEHEPFGSSTADSERAMITPQTTALMMVIISFDGEEGLAEQVARATNLLENYAHVRNTRSVFVT